MLDVEYFKNNPNVINQIPKKILIDYLYVDKNDPFNLSKVTTVDFLAPAEKSRYQSVSYESALLLKAENFSVIDKNQNYFFYHYQFLLLRFFVSNFIGVDIFSRRCR